MSQFPDPVPDVEEQANAAPSAPEYPAAETAKQLSDAIQRLEIVLTGGPASYGRLWQALGDLQKRVSTSGLIAVEEAQLQARLRTLSTHLRAAQKDARKRANEWKSDLLASIDLASEAVAGTSTARELHEARSDLAVIRERFEQEAQSVERAARETVWDAWQAANRAVWNALTHEWEGNRTVLEAVLDRAADSLAQGQVRGAREQIRAFHASLLVHECSHETLRELRERANRLWQQADELGRQKHEKYLANAARRLERWNRTRDLLEQTCRSIQEEIRLLERQAPAAGTDVGAALLRGRLAERKQALARERGALMRLTTQIQSTEEAVNQGVRPPANSNQTVDGS